MKLLRSFGFALSGIKNAAVNEMNFRIHTVAAVSVIWFARVYGADKSSMALICAVICAVMAGELINTAAEAIVDMVSPEKSRLAKLAKDSAAGAVLVTAAGAVAVACFVFSDTERLGGIWKYVTEHYLIITLYIAVCAAYIFVPRHSGTKERKK